MKFSRALLQVVRDKWILAPTVCVFSLSFPGKWWHPSPVITLCEKDRLHPLLTREQLIQRYPVEEFDKHYDTIEKVGQGGFASIYRIRHRGIGSIRIAKVVHLSSQRELDMFTNEVRVLTALDSPYTARIVDFYLDEGSGSKSSGIIVLQYIEGQDLLDVINSRIETKKKFTDTEIKAAASQMLKAVRYVHSRGFIHRDIKPENFVCARSDNALSALQLIDFGLARKKEDPDNPHRGGTSYYMAPEVFSKSSERYTSKSDLWSIGVILVSMASLGEVTVGRATPNEELKNPYPNEQRQLSSKLKQLETSHLSDGTVTLIRSLLQPAPADRPTPEAALAMIATNQADERHVHEDTVVKLAESVIRYAELSIAERIARVSASHQVSERSVVRLSETFQALDVDGKGYVTISDFTRASKTIDDDRLASSLLTSDLFSNEGKLSFESFIAACAPSGLLLASENLGRIKADDRLSGQHRGVNVD